MSWEAFLQGKLCNELQPDQTWVSDVVQEAAIVSYNCDLQAASIGFSLSKYAYDIKINDLETKKILVDEAAILTALATEGKSNLSEAGIRISNAKYTLAYYDPARKLAYLAKTGGGATMMATKTVVIFASYNTQKKMSNGVNQNAGKCNEVVEKLAKELSDMGI